MEGRRTNGSPVSRAEFHMLGELFDEKLKPVNDTLGRIEPKVNELWDVHIVEKAMAENEERQRVEDESRWSVLSSKANTVYPVVAVLSLLLAAAVALHLI